MPLPLLPAPAPPSSGGGSTGGLLQRAAGGLRRGSDGVMTRAEAGEPCCCGGPPCPHCDVTPAVWEVTYAGVTICPGFEAFIPDPNGLWPNHTYNPQFLPLCDWADYDGDTTSRVAIGDLFTPGFPEIGPLLSHDISGFGTYTVFEADEVPYGPDCSITTVFNNKKTVVGDCGSPTAGYGGTATIDPVLPP